MKKLMSLSAVLFAVVSALSAGLASVDGRGWVVGEREGNSGSGSYQGTAVENS
jgi:hypothetical protein